MESAELSFRTYGGQAGLALSGDWAAPGAASAAVLLRVLGGWALVWLTGLASGL